MFGGIHSMNDLIGVGHPQHKVVESVGRCRVDMCYARTVPLQSLVLTLCEHMQIFTHTTLVQSVCSLAA
jgi:hypothetical protein